MSPSKKLDLSDTFKMTIGSSVATFHGVSFRHLIGNGWYLIFFCEISSKKQDCPCKKKLEGALQIRQTSNRRLKLVEVCSLKFLQNYFQCKTFPLTFMLEMQMRLK